jgi:hypothetical protein
VSDWEFNVTDNRSPERAKRYRDQAAACLEWASKMSLEADRTRMTEMALQWLDLAKEAEASGKKE